MTNPRALGIIFPNLHDDNVPELVAHRTIASMPFAGRYRMVDFALSGMANAGMRNVGIIARKNYQSLMDHLGSGREWDLARKRGGLVIFPPYARDGGEVYRGRVQALASVMDYLRYADEEYVVMSDCDIAFNLDYKELMERHAASGADVTMLYEKAELKEGLQRDNVALVMNEESTVTDVRVNEYRPGVHNLWMHVLVMGREYLMNVVREAMVRGETKFVQGYLANSLSHVKVQGCEFTGYRARIFSLQSYFEESMRLLNFDNLTKLFPRERPVYTKVRDEAPVRYAIGAVARNCLVADGCIIEGEIENCLLFRGVRVGKGAKLKNCILMQGGEIEPGVAMENVITDKDVRICRDVALNGTASFPVVISKGCVVN